MRGFSQDLCLDFTCCPSKYFVLHILSQWSHLKGPRKDMGKSSLLMWSNTSSLNSPLEAQLHAPRQLQLRQENVNCDIIDYRHSDFLTKSDFIVNLPNQYPYHITPHPCQHLSIGNETCKRQDTIHMLEMDQNCEQQNLGKTTANQVAMKGTLGWY